MVRGANKPSSKGIHEKIQEEKEDDDENTDPNIDEDLLGFRKIEYFKNQCRQILGPSKVSKSERNLERYDDDDDFLEDKESVH